MSTNYYEAGKRYFRLAMSTGTLAGIIALVGLAMILTSYLADLLLWSALLTDIPLLIAAGVNISIEQGVQTGLTTKQAERRLSWIKLLFVASFIGGAIFVSYVLLTGIQNEAQEIAIGMIVVVDILMIISISSLGRAIECAKHLTKS